jgi:DNA-3-methyladenine glycosylase
MVVESRTADGIVAVRLVEVEAYGGEEDPASHAWRGPTPRTRVMYGPPGHAYVYLSHGIHWCLNVVTGPPGRASAVLLRAGEVVEGEDLATWRRGGADPIRLARGPGLLGRALGLDGSWDGIDLTDRTTRLGLRRGAPLEDDQVVSTGRVGVRRGIDTPWRFLVHGNPHVSGPRGARG